MGIDADRARPETENCSKNKAFSFLIAKKNP